MSPLAETARANVASILDHALAHPRRGSALVLFDTASPLAALLAAAWREILGSPAALDVSAAAFDDVDRALDALPPGTLVVLVASDRIFPERHRFRVQLFERGFKVVEHPHLGRMSEDEIPAYVDALAYDFVYYRSVGPALKGAIDAAASIRVESDGAALVYRGPFEPAKLNVGDYRSLGNVGGQFPIGEVFTEPADLSAVDGDVDLFAFGDAGFRVVVPDRPIRLRIERGIVADVVNAPASFAAVLDAIRAAEEVVRIRELGFGLNRALTRERRLSDVGSYERMCGVHLSLGAKHAIYAKPGIAKRRTKFHVDVFVALEGVEIDGRRVYGGGAWGVSAT